MNLQYSHVLRAWGGWLFGTSPVRDTFISWWTAICISSFIFQSIFGVYEACIRAFSMDPYDYMRTRPKRSCGMRREDEWCTSVSPARRVIWDCSGGGFFLVKLQFLQGVVYAICIVYGYISALKLEQFMLMHNFPHFVHRNLWCLLRWIN